MRNTTEILGGELVNGKYSKALFESVDSKFTEVEISAEDKFDLTSSGLLFLPNRNLRPNYGEH